MFYKKKHFGKKRHTRHKQMVPNIFLVGNPPGRQEVEALQMLSIKLTLNLIIYYFSFKNIKIISSCLRKIEVFFSQNLYEFLICLLLLCHSLQMLKLNFMLWKQLFSHVQS